MASGSIAKLGPMLAIAGVVSLTALATANALPIVNGVTEGRKLPGGGGPTGQVAVGDFEVQHIDGFKGARRVAISVFNVAFPSETALTANMKAKGGNMVFAARSSLHTEMTGVDNATRQRIADAAYAAFVQALADAGYEVVSQEALTKLTPEYATWPSEPNFSKGRFGTYVAPTGRVLRFLQGDTAQRDNSGKLGQLATTFRSLARPQALTRSPYLAHDGNIGVIAVTLVVDYGVYSTTGETAKRRQGAETSFVPQVAVQSGSLFDTASLVEYWGPKSGGFAAIAALAAPIADDAPFGQVEDRGGGLFTVTADPAKFEAAARSVAHEAATKLVGAMVAAR